VPSLITISRNGDYVVLVNEKELTVHTAAEFEGSRLLHCIKLKEPLGSQLKFLRISYPDTSAADDGGNDDARDEGLLDLVPHQRLLCASDSRLSVWKINSMEWDADIENVDPTITHVDFGARDDEVILFHAWNAKVTIFNLDSGRSQVIKSPKFCNPNGYGYRPRTRQFALLLKPETSDLLTLHEIQTYELITRVTLPTVDAQGLKWSPDGKWIAVWEAASAGTKVLIYTADGQPFRIYTGPSSESDSIYDLGVRTIEWSPNSQILAVGKFDGTVDLLNSRTARKHSSYRRIFN
jgi:WD40 repeat protein